VTFNPFPEQQPLEIFYVAARFTTVPKAFTADTSTIESKPIEAPIVVAVGKAFIQLSLACHKRVKTSMKFTC